ncbi:phage holin family protein [Pectinatus frisingensis]|uniref:phage holin family protein n=1 Tax=Pectinatus frisingensis TaxID=865 RepID=UPI0018C72525|nr:phage holin family protein [Pectinatus frisingensis]
MLRNLIPIKLEWEAGIAASLIGKTVSYLWGDFDKSMETLLVFMAIDYVSGVIAAYENPRQKLNSRRGFWGIGRKVMILLLVAVAHFMDYVTEQDNIRTLIVFFFIGNEGLSILENAANAGVPVPAKLKGRLAQFTRDKR